jgi:hypothetical protein
MAETPKQRNGMATLKTWWPIIICLLGLAVTWGTLTMRVDVLASEQTTIRVDLAASDARNTEILVRLAGIERDIQWIREQLSREGSER